jgi:cytoskeleton protein RodZ
MQENLVSRLDFSQIEQLKEIGDYLTQVRQQQAVPLEEVAARTYIPLRLLKALEAGQTELLPEPVFIQGFIRRYADLLGLDGIALARSFSTETRPPAPEPEPELPPQPAPEMSPVAVERPPSEPLNLSFLPYALVGVVALGVFGYALNQYLSAPKDAQPPSQSQSATVTSSSANTASSEPSPSSVTEPTTAVSPTAPSPSATASPAVPSDAPVQVTITVTGDSWVQITTDDKVQLEGILKKGYRKTWSAKRAVVLEAGNAGGVAFSYNQGEEEVLGKPGDVAVIRFTPEKAEVQPIN